MAYYRVVGGKHVGPGPEGCECERCIEDAVNEKRKPAERRGKLGHIYEKGEVVQADWDLIEKFPNKFALVDERGNTIETPKRSPEVPTREPVASTNPLDLLTVAELRKHAEAEEIDLGNATRKDEIIRLIREQESVAPV